MEATELQKQARFDKFFTDCELELDNIWADPHPYYDPTSNELIYWGAVRREDGSLQLTYDRSGCAKEPRTLPIPDGVQVPANFPTLGPCPRCGTIPNHE